MVPADSIQIARAGQSNADTASAALVISIRERLEQCPHFRGRTSLVTIELIEETLVLSGRLPSHYLKQLLQEAIKGILGVVTIDNQVDVVWPEH
jgi:hypothetical protein